MENSQEQDLDLVLGYTRCSPLPCMRCNTQHRCQNCCRMCCYNYCNTCTKCNPTGTQRIRAGSLDSCRPQLHHHNTCRKIRAADGKERATQNVQHSPS
jgi:hypothetical protein